MLCQMLSRRPFAAPLPCPRAKAGSPTWTRPSTSIGSRRSRELGGRTAAAAKSRDDEDPEEALMHAADEQPLTWEAVAELKRIRRRVSALTNETVTPAQVEALEAKLDAVSQAFTKAISTASLVATAGLAAKIEHLEAVIQANAAAAAAATKAENKIQRLQRALTLCHCSYAPAAEDLDCNDVIGILGAFMQERGQPVFTYSDSYSDAEEEEDEKKEAVRICALVCEEIHQLIGVKPRFEEVKIKDEREIHIFFE